MAIDRDKYTSKYIEEALENIGLVESLLFEIKDGVSVEEDLATLLRALHTLKGSSRMLEYNRMETLSHALESIFISLREQRIGFSDKALKLTLAALDALKSGLALIRDTKDDAIDIRVFEKELAALAANEDFSVPGGEAPEDAAGPETVSLPVSSAAPASSAGRAGKREEAKSESIRVSLEKIDDIIRSAASLQSLEIAARSIALDTDSLNGLIKGASRVVRNLRDTDPALWKTWRKIEQLQNRVTSALKNYAADTGNQIRYAYNSVISLRMLPISTILDSYPRYVYELASELGKEVKLVIEGSENEIDKNIIESLSDVFLHMVRNAVDHGLESPPARRASGKEETGQLFIRCSRESGSMKIVIADDGRGIDHERIRRKAVESGYLTGAAAADMGKEDIVNLIFQSGFSTAGNVSAISGRGVGLDVVRSTIERLKGSIRVDSVAGQGTTFTLLLPLSIAALTGFPAACGDFKFIIPSNFVDTILLLSRDDIITVVDRPEIHYQDRIIKLYYLEQVLHIQGSSLTSGAFFVVIIRAYDDIIALAVDRISSMTSVILKTLPSFMESIPAYSGMVLSEDYEMIPALHIPAIIKMAKRVKSIDLKKRENDFRKLRKSILVVDDSLPTREIESEILRAEGYKVDTAADGAAALIAAKNSRYDLICTDLNMPQMDGFMLTDNIKRNAELAGIPIIVISSRESEEDQKRAAMLGASRYIVKNSFNNNNLLSAVRDLIGAAHE